MKYVSGIVLSLVFSVSLSAQPVARRVVAEHFTNSFCSVCANRNPGLFQTLAQYPQVLHLAIYPSAPYAACPLNQYNKPAQDARTNYYIIYGSTPKLIVQGREIPSGTAFTNPSIFTSESDSLTAFDAVMSIRQLSSNTGEARVSIYKKDLSDLDSLWLYAVLAQDTLHFAANNGEQHHYDVFKKSIWGINPVKVAVPGNLADSVSYTTTFTIDAAWASNTISATVLLQRNDKRLEQAARSGRLLLANSPTAIATPVSTRGMYVYPNPAGDRLSFSESPSGNVAIYNLQGKLLQEAPVSTNNTLMLHDLAPGIYFIRGNAGGKSFVQRFVKR